MARIYCTLSAKHNAGAMRRKLVALLMYTSMYAMQGVARLFDVHEKPVPRVGTSHQPSGNR